MPGRKLPARLLYIMKKLGIFAGIFIGLIFFLCIPMQKEFTISNGKTGEIVYAESIANIREFAVSFRHSVNRTPVNEFVRIKGNKFVVYKTTFYSYGAGMPEVEPNSKQILTITDGLVQIDHIDRELKDFTYRVGTYAEHELSYGDRKIRLAALLEPQSPAFFSIKRVSLLELVRYQLKKTESFL